MAKLGCIFPGQGSQKIGMLSDYSDEPVVRDCLTEASDCVGYDVWDMIQNGSQETVTQTQRTQPILLSCSVALWRLWQHRGGAAPEYLAGHSLGEWSALVCADAVAFDDAVTIVEARGRLMQSAVPVGEGAMAAILGLPDAKIVELCHRAQDGDEVTAVNFNAPGQVVQTTNTDTITKTSNVPVDQYNSQYQTRLRGRSFTFKVQSTDADVLWRLGIPRVDIRPDGRR